MKRNDNDKKYIMFSSLSNELKEIYYYEIFLFLKRLVFEYKGFEKWYRNLFLPGYALKTGREIILCEIDYTLAGLAIVKNDDEEKKICTLRVRKEYQNIGIGHDLVELCFEYLNTDKPMVTIQRNKVKQFEGIIKYYDFRLEEMQKHYYNIFGTELVYNGVLPQKKRIISSDEIEDIVDVYSLFSSTIYKKIGNHYSDDIRLWYQYEINRKKQMINLY